MKRTLPMLALAPVLMATTCPSAVKVVPAPSTAHRPAFVFSHAGERLKRLDELSVTQCRPEELRRPVWRIARVRAAGGSVVAWDARVARDSGEALRIAYGETPEGFVQTVAPEALVPGRCYVALVSNGGSGGAREFRLLPDGRMEPGARAGVALRAADELNRAGVHCRRAYRRASAADSLRVDAQAHAVGDTTVTCADLRTGHAEVMRSAHSRETSLLTGAVVAAGLVWLIWDGADGD